MLYNAWDDSVQDNKIFICNIFPKSSQEAQVVGLLFAVCRKHGKMVES